MKQDDYRNAAGSDVIDADLPAPEKLVFHPKYNLSDTVNLTKSENAPQVRLFMFNMILRDMRDDKLTYHKFKQYLKSHAEKVPPRIFDEIMGNVRTSNAEKLQQLTAVMMNDVITDTQHALEMRFDPKQKFNTNTIYSEGLIYANTLPDEGVLILKEGDQAPARKVYYKRSEKKPGGYFLYNEGQAGDKYTGLLDLSGDRPNLWIAQDHESFKKSKRYRFNGEAAFIKTDVDSYLKESEYASYDKRTFLEIGEKDTYQTIYKQVYGEELPQQAVFELENNPRMTPYRFAQIVLQDITENRYGRYLRTPKNLAEVVQNRRMIQVADAYRLEMTDLTDKQLARAVDAMFRRVDDKLPNSIQEILRTLYPQKQQHSVNEIINAYAYSMYGAKPKKAKTKARRLLDARRDRLLLIKTRDPQVLEYNSHIKDILMKKHKLFNATESDVLREAARDPEGFRVFVETTKDMIDKRLKSLTPSQRDRDSLKFAKEWLKEREAYLKQKKLPPRVKTYIQTERGIKLQQLKDDAFYKLLQDKKAEAMKTLENPTSPQDLVRAREITSDIQALEDSKKIIDEYKTQKAQEHYSVEELEKIAKAKLSGVQTTFQKVPPLKEEQIELINRIQKSVGSSVVSVNNAGEITYHIASKQGKKLIKPRMDRIVEMM